MNNNKKNIIYTAADIEQYLSGKLSPVQMHEMEKAALDDPFLAEAMEGYEGMRDTNWKKQLTVLRRQIGEAGSEAKVIPFQRSTGKWWKVAAAVLVIGSGTTLTFILTKDKSPDKASEQVAQTIPDKTVPVTGKDNTALSTVTIPGQTTTESSSIKENIASANTTTRSDVPVKANDISVLKNKASAADTIRSTMNDQVASGKVNPAVTKPAAIENKMISADQATDTKDKELAKQNNEAEVLKRLVNPSVVKKEQPINNFFNAQVVAADNSPLPFSNISIKKENFGTYTDVKGNFILVSTDTVLNVEVRSAGYAPRTFALHSNQPQNKIVLLDDQTAIKSKTVIQQNTDMARNRKSRRATLLIDSVVNVEPADGWDNYNTYVANNIDIPDDILKKESHGEVEVTFDINTNGDISNIRINKSLGPAYDEAAKRIIMQGPQWKVKKGRKTSASVKLQF